MDTIPHNGEAQETGDHDAVAVVPRPGMVLAERYELVEPLGRGAAGWVWKAEHTVIRKHFAVKLMAPRTGSALGAESAARMLREAKSLSRFEHPNVIAVTDFGYLSETVPFIVMELLEGQTLQQVLDAGRLSWPQAKAWAEQILDGVGAAHEHGVIHRDIKPSNLFVTAKQQRIKVLDFGLAAVTRAASSPTTRITVAGDVFGTPMTMSPEQIGGEQTDARSDLYSLGCVLYEMLAGQPPVQGEPAEVLYQHVYAEPTPLRTLAGTDVPDHVCDVVHRCLAKAREDRPASCAEVRAALRRSTRASAASPRTQRSATRSVPWMLGAAVLASAGALFAARSMSEASQRFDAVQVDLAAPAVTGLEGASLWADPPRFERASPKAPVETEPQPAPQSKPASTPRRRGKPAPQRRPQASETPTPPKPRSPPKPPNPHTKPPASDASNPNLKDPFARHRGRKP
ncbi:MAG: protein kinase [Myxococcota bacterium]